MARTKPHGERGVTAAPKQHGHGSVRCMMTSGVRLVLGLPRAVLAILSAAFFLFLSVVKLTFHGVWFRRTRLPKLTLFRLLRDGGMTFGSVPALLADVYSTRAFVESTVRTPGFRYKRVRTYDEYEYEVSRLAAAYESMGFRNGERVVVSIANRVDILTHCFALSRAGAVPVPINPRLKETEFNDVILASAGTVVIADSELIERFSGVVRKVQWVWSGADAKPRHGEYDSVVVWLQANKGVTLGPTTRRHPDDPAMILCTSGTTGHPKAAVLTSRGLIGVQAKLFLLFFPGLHQYFRANRDVVLMTLPLTHVFGISAYLGCMCAGVKIVHLESFDKHKTARTIEASRINVMIGVPTMYSDLEAIRKEGGYDYSSVQLWISSADLMPADRVRRFQRYSGLFTPGRGQSLWLGQAIFVDIYGMVELSGPMAVRVYLPSPIRCMDIPSASITLPGFETRAASAKDGRPVGLGRVGVLEVRGIGVLRRYEGVAGNLSYSKEGGWFVAGDLVRVWPGGIITFVGRTRDRLKINGFSVFPAEVEAILRKHRQVEDVAVVGVPDNRMGERPIALVVPRSRPFDPEAFAEFCVKSVASYRRPRGVFTVAELPRGANGKIDRHAAGDMALEAHRNDDGRITPC